MRPPSLIASHADADSKEPGTDLGSAFELGEAAVDDQKHILHSILQTRFRNAQSTEGSPDECKVLLVEFSKPHSTWESPGKLRLRWAKAPVQVRGTTAWQPSPNLQREIGAEPGKDRIAVVDRTWEPLDGERFIVNRQQQGAQQAEACAAGQ